MAVVALTGCGTLSRGPDLGTDPSGDRIRTILPNRSVNLTPSLQIPLEGLLLGAAVYWVVDPLSPNWHIEHAQVGADTIRISLRRKAFVSGGEGEAAQAFKRRAEEIVRELGYARYETLAFSEGVDSTLPVARRVAEGVIQLR
jgi:hypothetical protein